LKIVLDAVGGDFAPHSVISGVVDALGEYDIHISLVGPEDLIRKELLKHSYPRDRLEVIHAPDVVSMNDPATITLRKKKLSSISVGVQLLKERGYDAFVSAGNTGAVVAASTVHLGMIEGVERPAIGLVIPTLKGWSFLLDVGANTEAKPGHLLHSAQLANVYVREVLGVERPRIGLLNIGEEEHKGSGFAKETHKLMDEALDNFIGNLEANEVFTGRADCIVCDGYVGNIVLKVSEGFAEAAGKLLKREIKKSPLAMLGACLMRSRLSSVRKLVDYSEIGGAPLLGVNGLVMISHGRSSPKAIKSAIRVTVNEVNHNILEKMRKEVKG
jgi:glycerol-3-phosphate acyltransferase PlsX